MLIFSYRFHNPYNFLLFVPFKLLYKDRVLARHVVGERQVVIACSLFCFALTFDSFFISFDIFRQQILPTNLIKVPKVINPLIRKQPNFIECFADKLLLAPIDIPVILFSLLVHAVC